MTRNHGDPAAEYAAARNGVALIARDDRALLRMYGRDPMRIIQGIVTNDVAGAAADRAVYAALLTAKGRMVADMRVLKRGAGNTDLLLDVPCAALTTLLELFGKTIPPLFSRFEDVTSNYATLSMYGPAALNSLATVLAADTSSAGGPAVMSALSALPARDGFFETTWHAQPVLVMTTTDAGPGGFDILIPVADSNAFTDAILATGAVRIGTSTADVLRIESGTPAWGHELDDTTIPLEADLLGRAISTNKGCYTGQEVIIRVLHRGHVNWHLRGFLLGDAPTPAAGTLLTKANETKTIGRITSAAYSPAHNQAIALGYARREVEMETDLTLPNGGIARVVALPFAPRHTTSGVS